jgi:hypothetical protein
VNHSFNAMGIPDRFRSVGKRSSVDDLEAAIYDYLLQHNAKPKPFVRSKTAADILTQERRALNALDEIQGNR